MENKKILITYCTYGSGHKSVANYIYDYFKTHCNYEIKCIDLMDYESMIGLWSKKAFEQNFKHSINSFIFDGVYQLFDNKVTTAPYKPIIKSIFKNKELTKEIVDFNPDILISSHFFGNIMVGMMNKKGLTHTKIISIITDYVSHEMWLKDEKQVNAFIVSNEMVKKELIEYGINGKKVYPYGIPLKENFRLTDTIENIKKKYEVNNNLKTFLFFAGGSAGSSQSFRLFKRMVQSDYDINIIYVCGKNESLKNRAEKLVKKLKRNNIKVLGFSTEVNNLLGICDVVITKPGGLSVTEALEMKKPMILFRGIGAQETYNAKFVSKNGYGVYARNINHFTRIMNKMLCKRNYLTNMEKNLEKYHDNKSVEKIFKLANILLKK